MKRRGETSLALILLAMLIVGLAILISVNQNGLSTQSLAAPLGGLTILFILLIVAWRKRRVR